jgi:hypothetical protein
VGDAMEMARGRPALTLVACGSTLSATKTQADRRASGARVAKATLGRRCWTAGDSCPGINQHPDYNLDGPRATASHLFMSLASGNGTRLVLDGRVLMAR